MIDEWGNEIAENKLLTLKEKIIKNKYLLFFLASVFVFTLIIVQIFSSIFLPLNKKQSENITPTGGVVTPKSSKKMSEVATSSAFINLEVEVATLSSQIENEDMYESSLVFPVFDQKIELNAN